MASVSKECLLLSVLVGVILVTTATNIPIREDIRGEILEMHNNLRRQVPCNNMLELDWDVYLQREAEQFASQCRYEHPSVDTYNAGFNLYWMKRNIHPSDHDMVKHFLTKAVSRWEYTGEQYTYSNYCNRSCPYTQMIQSDAEGVGCAVESCSTYQRNAPRDFTMLVCFYSPWKDLRVNAPYQRNARVPGCFRCPERRICQNGLCVRRDKRTTVPMQTITYQVREAMTEEEQRTILWAQNKIRRFEGLGELKWDDNYLQKWVNYVISCTADYPGPKGTFTNFHRLGQNEDCCTGVVDRWQSEGRLTGLAFSHGCRSKLDQTPCNHYTNMMNPEVNSVACATKRCDNRRHLVCVYDNQWERDSWRYTRTPRMGNEVTFEADRRRRTRRPRREPAV